jgi:hypothetical protein
MLVLTMASVSNAQNIDSPDTAFLHALIDEGVDTNGDSLISYSEAEAVTSLKIEHFILFTGCVDSSNIASYKGIEAFTNLDTLICTCVDADSLNLSSNPKLKYLDCSFNKLTSLDVSYSTALTSLWCWGNQLTSLDVSKNAVLTELYCFDNKLTSLDVSNNTALEYFDCGGNQLINLDVSHNTALQFLNLSDMPTLHGICVWEMPFPPVGLQVDTTDSPNVYFTYCLDNIPVDYKENSTIDIYPNPSDDIINIEIENINNATIEIYSVSGKLVFSKALNSKVEKIDISGLSEGMYFVKVRQEQDVRIEKLIVY